MNMDNNVITMTEGLAALGVAPNDTILVHSSLRSLGPVEGGAEGVISAILNLLGGQGTLLMPSLSYENVTAENPKFDNRLTPACVGALPEYFRTRAGTVRSQHPTHSVCAYGLHAEAITQQHHKDDTPVGPHSPFRLLCEYGGKILMLGCGLRPNTSMHGVEELVVPPYLYRPEPMVYTLTSRSGSVYTKAYTRHNFDGFTQRYDRITDILSPDELRHGWILGADCYLLDAAALWRKGKQKLREEPLYFVDRL